MVYSYPREGGLCWDTAGWRDRNYKRTVWERVGTVIQDNRLCFDMWFWLKRKCKQIGGVRYDTVVQGERILLVYGASVSYTLRFTRKSDI